MTPIQNAIITSIIFLIIWWLLSGGTTFSGDPLPPPLLIEFIQWLRNLKRDGKTDEV